MPAPTKFVNGCTYEFEQHGRPVRVKLLHYDPIARAHVILSNGQESRLDMHALGARVKRARTMLTKKPSNSADGVYLYMVSLGSNAYKVGVSTNPERRRKQIRTCAPLAKLQSVVRMPTHKTAQWSKLEGRVLKKFSHLRAVGGGREVLRMSARQASDCADFMKAVCK